MANKIRFGLKNVHYAVLTEGSTNSWETPVHVPGAVSISVDSNVTDNSFYADNITYYKSFADNGYTGTLEMALISDEMLKDIWGMTVDTTSKVMYEKSGVQPKPFALLFQVEGDQDEELNLFYRVIPTTKPTAGSSTKGESVEPNTQSFDFEALPLVTGASAQLDLIKARTTADTTSTVRESWFEEVNVPT